MTKKTAFWLCIPKRMRATKPLFMRQVPFWNLKTKMHGNISDALARTCVVKRVPD
jgi:hypothetical protein